MTALFLFLYNESKKTGKGVFVVPGEMITIHHCAMHTCVCNKTCIVKTAVSGGECM